jgi:uncharacterized membrane protein
MALGYAFGSLYQMDPMRRRRLLLIVGGIATTLFVVLRALNIYGDPSRWSPQRNTLFTLLSFLNTTKYPPSLLFLLMTLGPAMLALAWCETNKTLTGGLRNALVTFGQFHFSFTCFNGTQRISSVW